MDTSTEIVEHILTQHNDHKERQARLTEAPQPAVHSPPFSTTAPSATFIFPTLAINGSVPDLTTVASARSHPPTPPAALSSAGAELASMSASMSSSTSSLADSNYDMVDDASDISNDDRDTASLHSTDHHESDEGAMTPEDSASVVDVEEEHAQDLEDSEPTAIPEEGSFQTLPATHDAVKEENSLLDSYMNDELETPKQSVLHRGADFPLSDSIISASSTPSDGTDVQSMTTLDVLFVSKGAGWSEKTIKLFKTLASRLSTDETAVSEFEYQVLRLPQNPHLAVQPSSLIVRFREIELSVQHCTGAEEQITPSGSYALQFEALPTYEKFTKVFSADPKGVGAEQRPDLVVFSIPWSHYPYWFTNVKKAMAPGTTPAISIGDRDYGLRELSKADRAAVEQLGLTTCESFTGKKPRRSLQNLLASKLSAPETSKPGFLATESSTSKLPAGRRATFMSKLQGSFPAWTLILMVVSSVAWALAYTAFVMLTTSTPVATLAVRRDALSTALDNVVNTTDATKLFSLNQLLPPDQVMNGTYEGFTFDPRSVSLSPNHIVISLPRKNTTRYYLQPTDATVYRSAGDHIDFNMTKLISGVYDVTIDPKEAYGTVVVNMQLEKHIANITSTHNFGMRSIQRSIQRTTTDMTKALNKDISLASRRVRGFKQKLGMELSAGAAATGNVTSELALYAARDVQVLANTALSVFSKAFASTHDVATRVSTSVSLRYHNACARAQTGVGNAKRNIKNFRASTKKPSNTARSSTKKSVRSALIASRDVAMGLKSKLTGRVEEIANSTSATKELSLRLQNLWNPTEKTKRAGGLADVAKCVGKEDYAACRKAYRVEMLQQAALANRAESKSKLVELAPQAEKVLQVPSAGIAGKASQVFSGVPAKPTEGQETAALEEQGLWQKVKNAERARWKQAKAAARAKKVAAAEKRQKKVAKKEKVVERKEKQKGQHAD